MREKFHTPMRPFQVSRLFKFRVLLVLSVLCVSIASSDAKAGELHCFAINVRLNGQPIEGPQSVTLKTRKVENTVSLDQKCFRVPDAVVQAELIEVSFTVPGSKIHMTDVPSNFLDGIWDVDLADKKFAKEIIVPKHASASEVCAVLVHTGDSDQSLAQPQCRTPLAGKQ